jgi:hypothetical protein
MVTWETPILGPLRKSVVKLPEHEQYITISIQWPISDGIYEYMNRIQRVYSYGGFHL